MAGWFKGTVKAVPSGDSLVIMAQKDGIPPEKSITLSSLMAPRLARRDTNDDPFAWQSREFLRNKCIGKEVTFRVDYAVANLNNREFGSVFMDNNTTNLALLVAGSGWAKVRLGAEKSPYFEELQKAEERAKEQGLGMWSKDTEKAIRSIPPSAIGDNPSFDAREFVSSRKGALQAAIVEQVRDGSSFRVYLLPSFQFVQVHLAGVQAPSMIRRAAQLAAAANTENGASKEAANGTPLTTAQMLAASASSEGPEEWAREAKHFTEVKVLHRDVRISLEGTDKFNTLFGSVSFLEKDEPVDLALELLKQGLARYAEWSANMLEEEEKRRLKAADLQAKRSKLRIYTGFEIPQSSSKTIKNKSFTGKVIEVPSSDCVTVADDSLPVSDPSSERRVNLSSIQGPKRGNNASDETRFRDAKEFLRTRVIGQQVSVFLEYSRTVTVTVATPEKKTEDRVLEFGSVFLASAPKGEVFETPQAGQPAGFNVAEMVVANGFASVVKHRDFDERSSYYDNLQAAEKKAVAAKKGFHAPQRPVAHINDLTQKKNQGKQFLPFLQRAKKLPGVVDFVFSGHRCKLYVPRESCVLFFTLSGVRCPRQDEPYGKEAIAFMRRRICNRDVEVEVENVDSYGTFLGSMYEGKVNVAIALLEAGLGKLQQGFADRIPEGHLLLQAQDNARKQRLKLWEKEEVVPESKDSSSKEETLEVQVTEVLDGGRFYAQLAGDPRVSSIQQQLESLALGSKPPPANFAPGKGEVVFAHFSVDNAWYRAKVTSTPKPGSKDESYDVFYMDYGNQERVPLKQLRPIDPSVALPPNGLAQLYSLAYIKVPALEEDFTEEAAEFLQTAVANKKMVVKVHERDSSGGKGARVTLMDAQDSSSSKGESSSSKGESSSEGEAPKEASMKSVNAALLEAGLARVEKAGKRESKEKKAALESLGEYQQIARKARAYMWHYGDVESDEDELPGGAAGRGRGAGRTK